MKKKPKSARPRKSASAKRVKLACPTCDNPALAGNQEPGRYPEVLACPACGWQCFEPKGIKKICDRAILGARSKRGE